MTLLLLLCTLLTPAHAVSDRIKNEALRCQAERETEYQRRLDANGIEGPAGGDCATHDSLRNYERLGLPVNSSRWTEEQQKRFKDPDVFVQLASPQESRLQACGMHEANNEPGVLEKLQRAFTRRFGQPIDLSRCGK